ncbi:XRE family transcriptional regulator [Petrocella sp. FN5]|uniref:XRE family transcriptional regulator n=1 Tax=Petrocella sp. FN5 TaxID=3032002 RepID=UPI0023DC2FA1|nr:XRE family transcriptional regulator [Petrocella sp. FN5]MDF1618601.1 XRE family transcriptional regulator [Petrocella sp. FN5]
MSQAIISPEVLKWARLRSKLNIDMVAQKVNVKVEKLNEWETGEAKPTFIQAQKLAKTLHIPFGYLFLNEPPKEKADLPDLRNLSDCHFEDFSTDLQDVISDVKFKQDWYRDFRQERGDDELKFIGKYSDKDSSKVIADEITEVLNLTIDDRKAVKNWEEFYQLLVKKAEEIGLWVMKSSMVGSNTHRVLDVSEFRGFVIADSIAPVIFINGADAKAAQIFTLIHEVVHLWFNSSGVSNIDFRNDKNSIIDIREKKCNEIAAEVLVPEAQLMKLWNKVLSVSENADNLCKYFKVSSIVIARRALDLDLILVEEFFDYYAYLVEVWKEAKQKMKNNDGGPSYYVSIPIRNGYRFSGDVLQNVYSHKLLMRDGARLLGLKPATLAKFAKEVGVR